MTPDMPAPNRSRPSVDDPQRCLFAGRVAVRAADRPAAVSIHDPTPSEIARVITTEDPPKPSDAATGRLRSSLQGDLDTMILMALRRDRERRYQSVEQLAGESGGTWTVCRFSRVRMQRCIGPSSSFVGTGRGRRRRSGVRDARCWHRRDELADGPGEPRRAGRAAQRDRAAAAEGGAREERDRALRAEQGATSERILPSRNGIVRWRNRNARTRSPPRRMRSVTFSRTISWRKPLLSRKPAPPPDPIRASRFAPRWIARPAGLTGIRRPAGDPGVDP